VYGATVAVIALTIMTGSGTARAAGTADAAAPAAVNRVVRMPMHLFQIDPVGLPAQLEILVTNTCIPLAFRAEKKWSAPLLRMITRGPQLAAPTRLEATVDKAVIPLTADAPATLTQTDKGVEAVSSWQAGALKGRLTLLYAADGSLTGQLTYDVRGASLERLELILELSGPVDTVIAGDLTGLLTGKQSLPRDFGTLDPSLGTVWSDGATPVGDGSKCKGPIQHFFLGNGDRGFTWLAPGGDGFVIGGKTPSMTVERKKKEDGSPRVIWRIALVNKDPGSGARNAAFTLLVHPSRLPDANRRQQQWQVWKEPAATPALDAAARAALTGSNLLVRAEAGSVCEARAARVLLEGPFGGDALTATHTIADRYPLALFRYLAAPHTALAAQLRSNGSQLATPGGSFAVDDMILGRALLHDIGVDVAGLANRSHAADVVNALEQFGYFQDDGLTEFLPYWRAEDFGLGLVRYGEAFENDARQNFALTAENPAGRVRVSVFLRPAREQESGLRKAMLVVVNESDHPVRELLYVENPAYLFSGENKLTPYNVLAEQNTARIPPASDWAREKAVATGPMDHGDVKVNVKLRTQKDKSVRAGMVVGCLKDPLTGGYVKTSKMGVGFTLFGPLYIPARGMRLLTASGAAEGGVVGSVWKVSRTGKRTPVSGAPVHFISAGGAATVEVVEKLDPAKTSVLATTTTDEYGGYRFEFGAKPPEWGVVVAEVDGKLYPDQGGLGKTKDGRLVPLWTSLDPTKLISKELGAINWVECTIEVLEGNAPAKIIAGPALPEPGKPWTSPETGIEFVWIPPGKFEMGSPAAEAGRNPDETLHTVTISKGFWMSKYEITQEQWLRVMGNNPSVCKYAGNRAPVENMTQLELNGFLATINRFTQGTGLRYLLPTEAQWEYACRAGSSSALYTGPLTIKGAYHGPELDEVAWYGGNSGIENELAFDTRKWRERQFDAPYSGPHPVGQKKPNAFGLYDMLGNVAEWTGDAWTNDWGSAAVTDPSDPPGVKEYIGIRGGAWNSMPAFCRAASRRKDQQPKVEIPPPYSAPDLGVRLVCIMNKDPVIQGVAVSAATGPAPLTVLFTAHATDADDDKLTYSWKLADKTKKGGGVASGAVVSNTYTRFGTNLVNLFVSDGKGVGASTNVTITVTRGANRLPVSWDITLTNRSGLKTSVALPVRDEDDDPIQFSIVTPPQHGNVGGGQQALVYSSPDVFRGPDSFTFKAWEVVSEPDGTVKTNYTRETMVNVIVVPRYN
jgi:formylglycine-generating enzyme required for sulfatase activity